MYAVVPEGSSGASDRQLTWGDRLQTFWDWNSLWIIFVLLLAGMVIPLVRYEGHQASLPVMHARAKRLADLPLTVVGLKYQHSYPDGSGMVYHPDKPRIVIEYLRRRKAGGALEVLASDYVYPNDPQYPRFQRLYLGQVVELKFSEVPRRRIEGADYFAFLYLK